MIPVQLGKNEQCGKAFWKVSFPQHLSLSAQAKQEKKERQKHTQIVNTTPNSRMHSASELECENFTIIVS